MILDIAVITQRWGIIKGRPHHIVDHALKDGHRVKVFTYNGQPWSSVFRRSREDNPSYLCQPSILRVLPKRVLHRIAHKFIGFSPEADFSRFVARTVSRERGKFDVVIFSSDPIPFSNIWADDENIMIYDCLDDWEGFQGKDRRVIQWEEDICDRADLVFAVSEHLADILRSRNNKARIVTIPNGVNVDDFQVSRARGRSDRFKIGYVGSIEEWFDWSIVTAIAKGLPDCEIVIVGPVVAEVSGVPGNVSLLGWKPYCEIPHWIESVDVGIVPFKINMPYIKSVSPIKMYEYLAAGIPVVGTSMSDLSRFEEKGVVYVGDEPATFLDATRRALATSRDETLRSRRRQLAVDNSWAKRWKQIKEEIMKLQGARTVAPRHEIR